MNTKRMLMCGPPDYYGVEYEINPWMNKANQPDRQLVMSQWNALRTALKKSGLEISVVDQVAGLPDMVFTANAGLVHKKTVLLSKFRVKQRAEEIFWFEAWFLRNGYS